MTLGPGYVSYFFRYSSRLLMTGGTSEAPAKLIFPENMQRTLREYKVGTLSRTSNSGAP